MHTLTIDEAIKIVPAIGASSPSTKVSSRYQFVSTKDVLEQVQQNGWEITNATTQSRTLHSQHRVTLVHKDYINSSPTAEGFPRIELFNSHNGTKRLMFAIGYFRTVCSNGLIVATGPAESIRTTHRFADEKLESILERVSVVTERFPVIQSLIEDFKNRNLTEEEQIAYSKYAIKGRFNYRPELPKRFKDLEHNARLFLNSRREQDNGDSVWQVYNRVQENLINGIQDYTRPIKSYSDNIRVNQLLWKGAETALNYNGAKFKNVLDELVAKDGKKGKISG